jgi:hypothetical protein
MRPASAAAREQQQHLVLVRAQAREGLVLAVGVVGPAVRPVQIPEPAPRPRVERRVLDDLGEDPPRLVLVTLAQPELAERGAGARVGQGVGAELAGHAAGLGQGAGLFEEREQAQAQVDVLGRHAQPAAHQGEAGLGGGGAGPEPGEETAARAGHLNSRRSCSQAAVHGAV